MLKLLLTGSGGQVGHEIIKAAREYPIQLFAYPKENLDITCQDQVDFICNKIKPDILINAVGYPFAKCEVDSNQAFKINAKGAFYLAAACKNLNIPLIYLSTDYVFDGEKHLPYDEQDPVNPLSIYGKSKAAGEQNIRDILPNHLIIRTSWVFGQFKSNFVKTMLALGRSQETIAVVKDQWGCPTSARDLAHTLLTITQQIFQGKEAWGTYHYCGDEVVSWYQFAEQIFQMARLHCPLALKQLDPVTSDHFPDGIFRPKYSALLTAKLTQVFGIETSHWKLALNKVISGLLSQ